MATPLHNNPCPGGHEIYNFGRPFLGHHYYTLSLYGPCSGVEKFINITHFSPKLSTLSYIPNFG